MADGSEYSGLNVAGIGSGELSSSWFLLVSLSRILVISTT